MTWTDIVAYNEVNRDRWVARQAASVPAGSTVLDVGAGRGPYRHLFAHCKYRAQDFGKEPATVGYYTELDYTCDVTAIPVDDGAFDVVLCTEVLEHVPDPMAAVKEMVRILRPGGRLLLTAPLGSILHQEPYHFYGGFTPYWYAHFLHQAGCQIVAIERNAGFFSLFGQEARRFHTLIAPSRAVVGMPTRVALAIVWLLTLPLMRAVFLLLGRLLDPVGLESVATAGYHVAAVKR